MRSPQQQRPARTGPARRHLFRRIRPVLLAAAGLILASAAWIAATGLLARNELVAAQESLEALRQSATADLSRGATTADARRRNDHETALRSAAAHAARAHHLTTGPAWYTAAHLPVLGGPLHTVRGTARAVDRVVHDVLPPLVHAVSSVSADRRGSLAAVLTALGSQAAALDHAAHVAADVHAETARLPGTTWLPDADRARVQLARQLRRISALTADAAAAARVLPPMLGMQSPRRYFVVFQNTAEARGTGGLPGAFAVLSVDRGRVHFERFGNNTVLEQTRTSIDLGAEYATQYGAFDPTGILANSNISPHFPYAARIWAAAWRQHSGQQVDGVAALDPSALARLLQATGPGRLPDGTALTAGNVVELTERTSYALYPHTPDRKAFFLEVARAASAQLMNSLDDPENLPTLLTAVHDVARDQRLKMWSAYTAEQHRLQQRSMGGVLPSSPGPFTGVVVNNAAATKLDYYLERSLKWAPGPCAADKRSITATVTLTNRAPASGLPPYVTDRLDHPAYRTQPGDNRVLVSYYASAGAQLTRATLDDRRVLTGVGKERGHPVYTFSLELPRGATRTLVLHLIEPRSDRPPVLLRQQLVKPLRVTVKPYPGCQ